LAGLFENEAGQSLPFGRMCRSSARDAFAGPMGVVVALMWQSAAR